MTNPAEDDDSILPSPILQPLDTGEVDDISEDVSPGTNQLARIEPTTNLMRQRVITGLGVLLAGVLVLAPIIVLVRPDLAGFATSYMQVSVGGLLGIAGSVVGFLFGREQGK